MSDRFWREVTPSRFPHEREALDYLRQNLPDHEPWRVWSNFDFMADDGSINEVDALVVSRVGFFLIEIKSHSGEVSGDQGSLYFRGETLPKVIDHPRRLTSLKCKRLIALIRRSRAAQRRRLELPRLEELVFLSHATASKLAMPAAASVVFRDGLGLPRVIEALTERKAPGLRPQPQVYGDKPLAKLITEALEEIGIVRRPSRARIGDYQVQARLQESAVYRDFAGHHVNVPDVPLRIRRYFMPRNSPLAGEQIGKATQREYRLLSHLNHPGILGARGFTTDEHGPVLIFEHDPAAVRLDRYLAEHGAELGVEERLNLLRKIAEPLRFAHDRGIVHRCLSPQSILVLPDAQGRPKGVKLMNWSTGAFGAFDSGEGTAVRTIVSATLHPEAYQEEASALYLAPELRRDPAAKDPTLDVFSLGAIAYHVFTGGPPGATPEELYERIREHGLDLGAALDAAPAPLTSLIARATRADVPGRFETVAEFLLALDEAETELSLPDTVVTDPREAGPGNTFPDGTRIVHRLGSGATAIAFLVQRGPEETPDSFVLKIAREPDHGSRMRREAAILRQLDHPRIARFVEDFDVGGFPGFLTKPASRETLRTRLRKDGAFQLELLERFGDQLLDALVYLEGRGINHRDVKPDNIAVSDDDKKRPLGLVLFDFSLSDTALDQIDVGTPQYLDPFLPDRRPKRWDLQAERFSAALTLHEMATGTLPEWGDGKSDPRLTAAEARLIGDLFPQGVRTSLLAFFRRALAADPTARFDNAEAMREAWKRAFHATDQPTPHAGPTPAAGSDVARVVDALREKTPLTELAFSTRARNALDKLDLFTVEALLATPPGRITRVRGVGEKTRAEIQDAIRKLRPLFPEIEIGKAPEPEEETPAPAPGAPRASGASGASLAEPHPAAGAGAPVESPEPVSPAGAAAPEGTAAAPAPSSQGSETGAGHRTVPPSEPSESKSPDGELPRDLDRLLARLRRGSGSQPARRLRILDAVLGLDTTPFQALDFPNQSRAAEKLELNPGTVSAELSALRTLWHDDPAFALLRDDLAQVLDRNGGILTPREAAEALLVERGSIEPRDAALQIAAALARAVTEAEAAASQPRWLLRRRDHTAWLAASDDHVAYAARILAKGDALADADPLPGRDAVEAALLDVARPYQGGSGGDLPAIPAARLARLVASAEPTIALSARGELYRAPLAPDRAVRLALGALVGAGRRHPKSRRDPRFEGVRTITPDEIHERIRSRYPEVAELPDRPALDELLAAAGWSGAWSDEDGAYRLRVGDALSVASASQTSLRTFRPTSDLPLVPQELAEARRFEADLRATVENRRFQLLKTSMTELDRAAALLRRRFPDLEIVDLDAELIDAIDVTLARRRVDPELFHAAEARGPGDPSGWSRVKRVVEEAVELVTERLLAGRTPICLRNVGLLARFDAWKPLHELNGIAGGSGERACLVLIPGDQASPLFTLFHKAVPALPNQATVVAEPWLREVHLGPVPN
jgi:serine/threonine protein kinase